MYYADYRHFAQRFPIRQARNTGRWGWERVHDCIDLNRCVHKSPMVAGRARKQAYRDLPSELVMGLDGTPAFRAQRDENPNRA